MIIANRLEFSICSRRFPVRRGLSLVEALVAVTVTTVAGAALLTSIGAAVQSSTLGVRSAVARGLAEQMMDEISAKRFPSPLDPSPSGATRSTFDDIDDYDGWSASPPEDETGRPLGTEGTIRGRDWSRPHQLRPAPGFLERFTRRVEVERVEPDGASRWRAASRDTEYRRVTVRVDFRNTDGTQATLSELIRVFSHAPPTP